MSQKTIKVLGSKIKIQVTRKFRCGNPIGYNVKVNDKRFFFCVLSEPEAIDLGYKRYVEESRSGLGKSIIERDSPDRGASFGRRITR